MDLGQVRDAIMGAAPSAGNAFEKVTGVRPGKVYGDVRKAGMILSANPVGAIASDLIFTDAFADGSMDARSKH